MFIGLTGFLRTERRAANKETFAQVRQSQCHADSPTTLHGVPIPACNVGVEPYICNEVQYSYGLQKQVNIIHIFT